MIRLGLPLIALTILGCAPKQDAAVKAPSEETGVMCNAEGLGDLVGQPKSEAVAADALKRSGARTLRWIAPGMMVTMDFRADRLNLHTDDAGKIVKAACG